MSEKWMRPIVPEISTIEVLWDSHDALQTEIITLEARTKRLETKVWELPPDVTIGQPVMPATTLTDAFDLIDARDKVIDVLRSSSSKLQDERNTALKKVEKLKQVTCILRHTIETQQVLIERKVSTNRNASKLLIEADKKIEDLVLKRRDLATKKNDLILRNRALVARIKSLEAIMRDAIQMIVSSFNPTDTTRKLSALLRSIL